VNNVNLCPQSSLDLDTWIHITNLTNLVSLIIEDVDMRMDERMSFLEMLSNLNQLETLHLSSISQTILAGHMVSPI
jgi:hypothetical protein